MLQGFMQIALFNSYGHVGNKIGVAKNSQNPKTNAPEKNNENKKLEGLNRAKEALASMKSSPKKINEAKKAHALARLQELKKQVELLKKMLNGDPKALAKALSVIARELKAIVKEYGDAIKGGVNVDTSVNQNAPQETSQNSENTETDPAENETVDGADNSEEVQTSEKPDDGVKETVSKTDTQNEETPKEETKTKDNEAINNYAKRLLTNEHGEFMKSVRKIIDELKHYMTLAKAKLKTQAGDKEGEDLIKDNEDALKDLLNEFQHLQQDIDASSNNMGNVVSLVA